VWGRRALLSLGDGPWAPRKSILLSRPGRPARLESRCAINAIRPAGPAQRSGARAACPLAARIRAAAAQAHARDPGARPARPPRPRLGRRRPGRRPAGGRFAPRTPPCPARAASPWPPAARLSPLRRRLPSPPAAPSEVLTTPPAAVTPPVPVVTMTPATDSPAATFNIKQVKLATPPAPRTPRTSRAGPPWPTRPRSSPAVFTSDSAPQAARVARVDSDKSGPAESSQQRQFCQTR